MAPKVGLFGAVTSAQDAPSAPRLYPASQPQTLVPGTLVQLPSHPPFTSAHSLMSVQVVVPPPLVYPVKQAVHDESALAVPAVYPYPAEQLLQGLHVIVPPIE